MKKLNFFAFAIAFAMLAFTSCSSDDDNNSIVDGITGTYKINVFDENNELIKKDMIISKAGETAVTVKLPNFENQGYSFGDVEILCSVVDEDGDICFSGSTSVIATRATYETTFSISGSVTGNRAELEINMKSQAFDTKLSTSGYINNSTTGGNNSENEEDQDNNEGENGESDEELTPGVSYDSMIVGTWNAVHYKDNEVSFNVPSYYTWTMTIGSDHSFSAYKYIPAEDEEEEPEIESYQGEWIIKGTNLYLVVNGIETGYFRIIELTPNTLKTTTGEGDVTTWAQK